jgi:hypothetical protein
MKNKIKEILTPSHNFWPTFRKKLEDAVTIYNNEKLYNRCRGDLTLAIGILESMEDIDVKETLIFFNQYGGSCDCKILVNVARIWNNQ